MSTLVLPGPPPTVPLLEPTATGASAMGEDVRAAARTVADVSGEMDTASAPADWEGDAAEAAAHAATAMAGSLDVQGAVLATVATALDAFTSAVQALEHRRDTLVEQHSSLAGRQRDLASRGASYTDDEEPGLVAEAATLTADIDAFVADVERWQRDVTTAEDALVEAFASTDSVAEGEDLLAQRSQDVRSVLDDLIARGVLPASTAQLSAVELQEWLREHPAAAAALLRARPHADLSGPPGDLGRLLTPQVTNPEDTADAIQRRQAALRALFESLPPEDAALLAMLYPGAVGSASGVPFGYRADANGVAVIDALAQEQARGDAADAGRVALYESILDSDRQIIAFDPASDGTIVELHGQIGPDTENIGVYVPGTGADLSSFQDVADRSELFVDADPRRSLAMVSWLGGDMPDDVVRDAPFNHYAKDTAPGLAGFSHDLRQELDHSAAAGNAPSTTYLGHSYGGATVGLAETHGLDADRVLHVASAGMGHGVDGPGDLPDSQSGVHRYSMTAPDDFIGSTRGTGWGEDVGHGADPDDFEGTERLHTGDYADGERIDGAFASHSGVFARGSDAWNNMVAVLTGGEAEGYRPPVRVRDEQRPRAPMSDAWGDGEMVDIP